MIRPLKVRLSLPTFEEPMAGVTAASSPSIRPRRHEAGLIKSSPQKLIVEHTDWRSLRSSSLKGDFQCRSYRDDAASYPALR
jgi:hypothetical protein